MLSRVSGCLTDRSDVSHSNWGWLDWLNCLRGQQWTLAWEDWAEYKQKLDGYSSILQNGVLYFCLFMQSIAKYCMKANA